MNQGDIKVNFVNFFFEALFQNTKGFLHTTHSCLCFLLYKKSSMKCCCLSLWGVMIQGLNGYPLSPRRYGGKTFSPPFTKLKMGFIEHVCIIKTCVEHKDHGCYQVNQGCMQVKGGPKSGKRKIVFWGDFFGSQCDTIQRILKWLVFNFYSIRIWMHVKVIKQYKCTKSQYETHYFQCAMDFWKILNFYPKQKFISHYFHMVWCKKIQYIFFNIFST